MIDLLKQEVARHGDRAAVVPIGRMLEIREDIDLLKHAEKLNNFQEWIVTEKYRFSPPAGIGFEARSIILVATPSPAVVPLRFTREGKRIETVLPGSYASKASSPVRIEKELETILNPMGFRVCYAPDLPHKLLAVRSGLARYGRNNISFVEGMGSFLSLWLFLSDLPCEEDNWAPIRQLDRCRTCRACLEACPNEAILPGRFLIDNQRCLTYFNEAGGEWDFPGWIDPGVHHTLYGCLRCQTICPENRAFRSTSAELVEFTEEETDLLWEGKPFEVFPDGLKQKVVALDMMEYLSAIPRNLKVLEPQAGWA